MHRTRYFLFRRLVNLKYKDGFSVAEHISSFQNLVNQLTTIEIKLPDELLAFLLLSSLPDSWETLVVSLSNSTIGNMTFDIVKEALLNEEIRRKGNNMASSSTHTEALVVESRGGSQHRNSHKSNDRSKSRGHSRGESRSRKDIRCYHC